MYLSGVHFLEPSRCLHRLPVGYETEEEEKVEEEKKGRGEKELEELAGSNGKRREWLEEEEKGRDEG